MTSLVSLRITNANINGSLLFGSLSWILDLKRIYFGNNKILGKVSNFARKMEKHGSFLDAKQ
jgi:hypothetical protein